MWIITLHMATNPSNGIARESQIAEPHVASLWIPGVTSIVTLHDIITLNTMHVPGSVIDSEELGKEA